MSAFARVLLLSFPIMIVTFLTINPSACVATGSVDLQNQLDRAQAGDVVHVPPGTYEGPVIIRKPIQVLGDQARIIHSGDAPPDSPLLLLETNDATIRGLQLAGEQAGIVVRGDGNQILDTSIQVRGTALKLEGSNRNRLKGLQITGIGSDLEKRSNGVEFWNSHHNQIEDSTLVNLQDAIYVDHSEHIAVRLNKISDSRYAVHMMFTERTEVIENDLEGNVTGAMVMEDSGSRIVGNTITKQAAHVQSQGLLLYNVQAAHIENNRIDGNRIGLYMDNSTGNRIVNNQLVQNFLGLQIEGSAENEFRANTWAGNVVQAQGKNSRNNLMEGNYWDDHQGLDLNGDGHSEISYQASPFFLSLTEAVPAYQLFFQSPGLAVLEELFTSDTENWLHDASPLMSPPRSEADRQSESRGILFWVSLLLLGAGSYPFWKISRRSV